MIAIPLAVIDYAARIRPKGYKEALYSAGITQGKTLYLDDESYRQLREKFKNPQARLPQKASLLVITKRFLLALLRWIAAGCPLVSRLILHQRGRICAACQFWRPQARHGLGKCDHPECGCTSFKRRFGTEICPANKWPEWARLP